MHGEKCRIRHAFEQISKFDLPCPEQQFEIIKFIVLSLTRGRRSNLMKALSAMLLHELRPVSNNAMEMKDWRLKTAHFEVNINFACPLNCHQTDSCKNTTMILVSSFLRRVSTAKNEGSCLFHEKLKGQKNIL